MKKIILCKFEWLKLIKNRIIIGGFIVAVIAMVFIMYTGFIATTTSGYYGDYEIRGRDAIQHNVDVANHYKGELTDKKLKIIVSDFFELYMTKQMDTQYYSDNYRFMFYVTLAMEPDQFLGNTDEALQNGKDFSVKNVHLKSMVDVGFKESKKTIIIGNFVTWTDFFRTVRDSFLIVSLFIILICTTLFSNEKSTNQLSLLFSTRFGRTKLIRAKIATGIGLTTSLFCIVQLVLFLVFLLYVGLDGWDTSVQANFDMVWKPFNFVSGWNQLGLYIFYLIFQLISLICLACFVMFVSSLVNSSFSALAISLGLFFLPMVLFEKMIALPFGKLLYLFPLNNFEINKMVTVMSEKSSFLFDSFEKNMGCIILVGIVMSIVFSVMSYKRMNKLSTL